MNKTTLRQFCLDCLAAIPDMQADDDTFAFQWELLEAKGLLGEPISFGPQHGTVPERGLFGLDLDPGTEAVLIGVLSNLAYDAIKLAATDATEWMHHLPDAAEIERRLGRLSDRCRSIAARVWKYGRENIGRYLDDLRD